MKFLSDRLLVQVFFEQGNHWLYIEEPEKFNQLVVDFAEKGLAGVSSKSSL
jgi:pimeloyl-ACP methyl ester carboxylesterase